MENPSSLDNKDLALLIAVGTVLSYVACQYWWRYVPHIFYPEEKKLEERIALLRAEAERYNGTDQLHLRGKLCRESQQVMKELAQVRQRRFNLCFRRSRALSTTPALTSNHNNSNNSNSNSNNSCTRGKGEYLHLLLHNSLAHVKYLLPGLMSLLISFGFMLPVVCLYGARPAIVPFPRCFRVGLPFLGPWLEPLLMSLLLGPLLWGGGPMTGGEEDWGNNNNNNNYNNNRGGGSTTGRRVCSTSTSMNSDNSNTNTNNMNSGSGSGSGGDGMGVEEMEGMIGGMNFDCDTEAEAHALGVLSWFLACYIAVRFTHRVLSRR